MHINSHMILSLLIIRASYSTLEQLENHVTVYLHTKDNLLKSQARRISSKFVKHGSLGTFCENDGCNQIVKGRTSHIQELLRHCRRIFARSTSFLSEIPEIHACGHREAGS